MNTARMNSRPVATTPPGTSPPGVHGSLLKETDLGADGFYGLLEMAARLKAEQRQGAAPQRLSGRTIALIFEKNSTRTRCAFEVAAHQQGGHCTYLGPDGSHIGREESIADTAMVLSHYYDGIEFRGFSQETVEILAANATVPVWNGLTDQWHPTQMLADMLTMSECLGRAPSERLVGVPFTFVGDGRSNVARSLLVTGAMLGMDVRIAAPHTLAPPVDVAALAEDLTRGSGGSVTITDDLEVAVRGSVFVYTDVWVSMGESEDEWAQRVPLLREYQITPQVMALTGRDDTKFMHCLPAIHDTSTTVGRRLHDAFGLDGAEVTDDVFRSPASVVFAQAGNRMHTIKAVLVAALGRHPDDKSDQS